MQDKPFRLAFIGGGIHSAVGETHKIASQMDGFFKLVAGCFSTNLDLNHQTAKAWGLSSEQVFENHLDLLKTQQDKVDAIVVLTPTDSHQEIILEAFRYGYAVICEKSLATSLEDGYAILEAQKKHKSFLSVTFNYTGYPMIRELKQIITDDVLGDLQQIQIEMPQEAYLRQNLKQEVSAPQAWRLQDSCIPKISLDLGSHLHHMILFLTGKKAQEVIAVQNSFGAFPQVIDSVSAIVKYTDSMLAQFWFTKAALGQRNGLKIRIYGTKGSAEWLQLEPELIRISDVYGNIQLVDRTGAVKIANQKRYNRFKAGHPAGFIEAFANYYQDIAFALKEFLEKKSFSSPYVFGAQESCEGLAMLQAAKLSTKTNAWESCVIDGPVGRNNKIF
jgi:predicted dehydrogenase